LHLLPLQLMGSTTSSLKSNMDHILCYFAKGQDINMWKTIFITWMTSLAHTLPINLLTKKSSLHVRRLQPCANLWMAHAIRVLIRMLVMSCMGILLIVLHEGLQMFGLLTLLIIKFVKGLMVKRIGGNLPIVFDGHLAFCALN